MSNPRAALRALLAKPGPLVVPEALAAGPARMIEVMGFPAIWVGGQSVGALHFAIPDHGLIEQREMIDSARRIVEVVEIPVICDADQCGETVLNVRRTIKGYEKAGVAAITIEDTVNPKHMFKNDRLMSIEQMCARIAAAADARTDADFLIIARTDSGFNKAPVEETIERGRAYAEAGADIFFPCLMPTEQVVAVAKNVPIPLMDMNVSPALLADGWHKVSIAPGLMLPKLLYGTYEMLKELQETGSMPRVGLELLGDGGQAGVRGMLDEMLRDDEFKKIANQWLEPPPGFRGGRK